MFWLASVLMAGACSFDDRAAHCQLDAECAPGRCYEGFCIAASTNTSSSAQTGSDAGKPARPDGSTNTNTGGNRSEPSSNGGRGGRSATTNDGGTKPEPPVTDPGGPGECSKDGEERPCLVDPANKTSAEACNRGMQTCIEGGWSVCSGQPMPTTEVCNGRDDDCNGQVDDLVEVCYLPGQAGCTQGSDGRWTCSGTCGTGTRTCRDGKATDCEGATGPVPEECTPEGMVARNENCDDQTDEGCDCRPGETRSCYSGRAGTMNVGKCKAGTQACDNGALGACQGEVHEEPESCANANVDDDCNGSVDDVPTLENVCFVGNAQGPCANGTLKCSGAALTCVSSVTPSAESCNGMDDDCNGRADETFNLRRDAQNCGTCGNRCPAGQVCCGGSCTNTTNDNNHCGACGRGCPDATRCNNAICMSTGMPMAGTPAAGSGPTGGRSGSGGAGSGGSGSGGSPGSQCSPACGAGTTCCNGACVDLSSDPNNCNTCGNACEFADSGCCSGSCVNFLDNQTCGACNKDCSLLTDDGVTCSCTKSTANVIACTGALLNLCL
jgi:hypothetical protein